MVEYYTFPPLDAPHTLTAEMQATYTVAAGYEDVSQNYGASKLYYRRNTSDAWTEVGNLGAFITQDVGKLIYFKQEVVNNSMISNGTRIIKTDTTETVETNAQFTVDSTIDTLVIYMPNMRIDFTWDAQEISKVEIEQDGVWTEISSSTKTTAIKFRSNFKLRATVLTGVTFNNFKISVDSVVKQTVTDNPTSNLQIATQGLATIDVDASITSYQITVEQPEHGTITPGTGMHEAGTTPRFTITPNEGYRVVNILVDGVPVQPDYNYDEE